jgi:hypothetical protein
VVDEKEHRVGGLSIVPALMSPAVRFRTLLVRDKFHVRAVFLWRHNEGACTAVRVLVRAAPPRGVLGALLRQISGEAVHQNTRRHLLFSCVLRSNVVSKGLVRARLGLCE